ncbi:MAG TPA: hypothetical protein VF752_15660 [Thermoleophilaceae bacterium]
MRKILIPAAVIAAAVAVPAQAKSPNPHPPQSHKCKPHSHAYVGSGALVSQSLTQTQGAATATKKDDRWSGDITVNVTRANHHAQKGEQTYTLTDARVRWYDANHDGTSDVPAAGDRVKLIGKITTLSKKCDQTGFTPTTTIKKAYFKKAKAPKS